VCVCVCVCVCACVFGGWGKGAQGAFSLWAVCECGLNAVLLWCGPPACVFPVSCLLDPPVWADPVPAAQIPLGLHWMSSITELRLDNNPSLRAPPQTVRRGQEARVCVCGVKRCRPATGIPRWVCT
jgi:hypothetical protein